VASQNDIDLKIKALLDDAKAATSLKDLKKSMVALQNAALEFGDTNQEAFNKVTSAAGELKDKLGDTRASIQSLSGAPIENLSASLNLANGSLKSMDFGQVSQGLKNFATSIKGVSFADIKTGLKGIAEGFVEIGKALLANPIFLIAAIAVAIGAAFYALKDNGGAVAKVFGVIGDAIKIVVDAFKALSDAIGLTDFAGKKRNENELKRLEVEKAAIEERYAMEVSLAEATGKSVTEANEKKFKDAQKNAADLLQNTKDRIALTGRNEKTYTEDEKKEIAERVAAYKAASNELNVFYLTLQKQARDNSIKISKELADSQAEVATNTSSKARLNAKSQSDELRRVNKEEYDKQLGDYNLQFDRLSATAKARGQEAALVVNTGADDATIKAADDRAKAAAKELNDFVATNGKAMSEKAKTLGNDLVVIERAKNIALFEAQQSSLSLQRENNSKALSVILTDTKSSYETKQLATKEYLVKEEKAIADSYDIRIKIASLNDSGNVKKIKDQKALELQLNKNGQAEIDKQLLEANNKFKAEMAMSDADFIARKIESDAQYHILLDDQLQDDLNLIKANRDSDLLSRKAGYDAAKLEAVGNADKLKQIELEYQRDITLINDNADKAAAARQKAFNLEKQMRVRQDQLETIALEKEHLEKTDFLNYEAKKALINREYVLNGEGLESERVQKLSALVAGSEEYLVVKAKYDALEQQNEDAHNEALSQSKIAIGQRGLAIAQSFGNALGAINDVLNQGDNNRLKLLKKGSAEAEAIRKKMFQRQKAFSIAQAIMTTAASVMGALAMPVFPAGVPFAIANGVMGAAQVAKIALTKFDSQAGDSGGGGSGGGGAISAPSIASAPTLGSGGSAGILKSQNELTFGSNKLNSIGNSQGQSPYGSGYQRVYVLESDITHTQNKVAVTTGRSTLSGI